MTTPSRRTFIHALATTTLAALASPGTIQAQTSTTTSPTPNPPAAAQTPGKRTVGIVLFDGFQCLDVFGPLEMLSMVRDRFTFVMLAEKTGPVRSGQGPVVMADRTLAEPGQIDILIVPGGMGTRREVNNPALIAALNALAVATPHVASVCTGSALLARTGLLDGKPATSNKRAYAWATSQGPSVAWVAEARWVETGKYFTSSGISAGMDMALGLIERLFDRETAEKAAQSAEYEWHSDPHRDPFAKLNGLVP